jgi:peptide/nickel transport system ATP-binding protein
MIEIAGLTVRFRESLALDDFSYIAPEGKTTVIIGESGSGKSVMLSAILRILPKEANVSGSVKLKGIELLTMRERDFSDIRGTDIAYVPQGSGHSLNPLLKTGFQIAEPIMKHHKLKKLPAIERAIDLMRSLNIGDEEHVANSYPHTLSGGMKQRSLIAMGVASEAPIILADEPTKGLDYKRVAIVEELFARMKGHTILCVSHDLRFAAKVADRIVVIYSAEQVEEADAAEFFSGPLHPYSKALLKALPENGMIITEGYASENEKSGDAGCRFFTRCPVRMEQCLNPPPIVYIGSGKVRCHKYADESGKH